MRLSKIKLAGFKSFVDPTIFQLPSNLVGVVGPNGCGKSNIIDAVRWVMGEMSAKHLRGDSMADVIFNGSSSRKPVGSASIELFFDNSDGSIGGQYAQYAEISLRRTLSRDGSSSYFLNGTRCRRKDITDLFLGTGLGSRSYAIIEQGMVSRLIDAKPEEIRAYIEEAAGISKYKERRKETESRIRQTRDNLARLGDLREEIAKQLDQLQRQAKAAEKYKELKARERRLEAELLALRLAELDGALASARSDHLRRQTELEAAMADQRRIEAELVAARERHAGASDAHNAIQARHYAVQGEISRLEQDMAHARENRERQQAELLQSRDQAALLEQEVARDRQQLAEMEAALQALEPEMTQLREAEAAAAAALAEAERALSRWQDGWQEYNLGVKELQQVVQLEQARCEHIKAQIEQLQRQGETLEREQTGLAIEDLDQRLAAQDANGREASQRLRDLQERIQQLEQEADERRRMEQQLGAELGQLTRELASCQGQIGVLEAMQKAALRGDDAVLSSWLSREELAARPRLVQELQVERDWLQAVETVLGDFLQAVCVSDVAQHLGQLPETRVTLVEHGADGGTEVAGTLLARVRKPGRSAALLGQVLTADGVGGALELLRASAIHQSVITRDGVWMGHGWVRINRGQRNETGVLTRETELRDLAATVRSLEARIQELEGQRSELRDGLAETLRSRAELAQAFNAANREHAEAMAVLESIRHEIRRAHGRREALSSNLSRISSEISNLQINFDEAGKRGEDAVASLQEFGERRPGLQREQESLLARCGDCRSATEQARADVARRMVEIESRRVARDSIQTAISRVELQQRQLQEKADRLEQQVGGAEPVIAAMQTALSGQLEVQLEVDRELIGRREELELIETAVRSGEAQRSATDKVVNAARELADGLRMQVREIEIRHESVLEGFVATGAELDTIRQEMSAEAEPERWQQELDGTRRRIERLGPINLAAIEQYSEQAERKTYLDAQNDDLTAALETLEQAIRKIERETRVRFQETFDSINQGLKRIFPRLFGGGHAYLSLEGEDVLSAGVTIMARPPGKRNSHIHLLSGGEKALTAVSLIFSIFELNPAPFCLLDEVDAPLDEANVGRFCDIVREMSQQVQFVVITHNKTTMEMVNQLIGVTMNEPGVSRLVSVDLDSAVRMAAS